MKYLMLLILLSGCATSRMHKTDRLDKYGNYIYQCDCKQINKTTYICC